MVWGTAYATGAAIADVVIEGRGILGAGSRTLQQKGAGAVYCVMDTTWWLAAIVVIAHILRRAGSARGRVGLRRLVVRRM